MKISELRKRSNKFVSELDSIIEKAVNYNEDLEQLNKQQLKASKLANDQSISPKYSPGYAAWKSMMYPQSFGDGKVNLFLTGDMYNNMEIKAKGREYKIISMLPYVAGLIRKYSDKIFGIAPSNQTKAKEITSNLIAMEYKKRVL